MAFDIKNLFQVMPEAFGLDISDNAVKFMQLERDGRYFQPAHFGEIQLPRGVVEGGTIRKPKALAKKLRQEFKQYPGLSPYVIASLPDEEVFLKLVRVPRLTGNELKNAVRVEAERNIPIASEKAALDFSIFDQHTKKDVYDTMIVASRDEVVASYAGVLKDAGLHPLAIEPEVSAIARAAISGSASEKPIITVEIGANRTRLLAFARKFVVLTGSAEFGAERFVEAIAKGLNISVEEAAKMEWTPGLLKGEHGEKITEALTPLFSSLGDSIQSYIRFIRERMEEEGHPFQDVSKIILSGGGARVPGIEKHLGVVLKIPVKMVNPWTNVLPSPLKETPEISREESVRYTTAIGLALRGVERNFENVFSL